MDRVLELLSTDSTDDLVTAIALLKPTVLSVSSDQQKHKLKTRISALLKSSHKTRAYGAILARHAMVDWSVIKSHGASWVTILLHALDLPDQVCWAPITRTLTYLFAKVHGKADLVREVAGSRIGDFMKRLVSTLPTTKAVYAAKLMLQLYPTQCRPSLNKLEPVLKQLDPNSVAYLCLSEKQGAEILLKRLNEHLDVLRSYDVAKFDENQLSNNLQALQSYVLVASNVNAKIPAQALFDVLIKLFSTFTTAAVCLSCAFIKATFPMLKTMYIQQFDNLVYVLSDCLDMGSQEAVNCIQIITMLVASVGWISENYYQLFTRLVKKAIHLFSNDNLPIGAQGLADYVQNPSSFYNPILNKEDRASLLKFLTAVIVYVPGIPQSCRTQVDRIILDEGSCSQIVTATLYPTKYSILPLAIEKNPELHGLEALVHPRFPPLNTSKHLSSGNENENEEEPIYNTFEKINLDDNAPNPESVEELGDDNEKNDEEEMKRDSVPLPKIPESNKLVHRPELNHPPEKRAKLETSDLIQQKSAEPMIDSADCDVDVETTYTNEEQEGEENDEDDELIIPTLSMDSD